MKKIAVVGGDLRLAKVAEYLAEDGYVVEIYGSNAPFSSSAKVHITDTLRDCLHDAHVIVLGLPATCDDETVSTPNFDQPIYIRDILRYMPKDAVLLAGRISEKLHGEMIMHGIRCVDYFQREELTVRNSIPTAEGALQIAMEELPITLHGSRSLVLGVGRIGKVLAKMLHGIGSDVTCSARKHYDKAWIDCMGYHAIDTAEILPVIDQFDVIFNTIPVKILSSEVLSRVRHDSLVVDLASKPGGVDFEAAKERGLNVIWALSLPGKVAPATAGEIIKETIVNIMNEIL